MIDESIPNNKNLDTTSPLRMPCRKRKKKYSTRNAFQEKANNEKKPVIYENRQLESFRTTYAALTEDALPYAL